MRKVFYLIFVFSLLIGACKKNITTPVVDLKFDSLTRNCGEFVVYKYGTYKGDSITFELRNYFPLLDTLSLKTTKHQLGANDSPQIQITNYKNYVPISFCPGAIPQNYQPEPNHTWISESGILNMTVVEKLSSPPSFPMYKVTFELQNVVLKNEIQQKITLPSLKIEKTIVGGPIPG